MWKEINIEVGEGSPASITAWTWSLVWDCQTGHYCKAISFSGDEGVVFRCSSREFGAGVFVASVAAAQSAAPFPSSPRIEKGLRREREKKKANWRLALSSLLNERRFQNVQPSPDLPVYDKDRCLCQSPSVDCPQSPVEPNFVHHVCFSLKTTEDPNCVSSYLLPC